MEWKAIGRVVSAAQDARDDGWGAVVSEIRLEPEFARGLEGLAGFSHAIVLFHMHQAPFDPAAHLVRRPRDRADLAPTGIFAQRARHRPNPIGLTTVAILSVELGVLRVKGLDAIDGSPVLDIKPYFPAFDRPAETREPSWVEPFMQGYF
jgi:tRNA-Thr(GGU) m(6)t(6)A37 methyltransferase TsaA